MKYNLELLNDLLYKLSNMKNIKDYDTNILVYTTSDNKKDFKQILLENPNMYFTNVNVKSKISSKDINEISKRKIVIVDFDLYNDLDKLSKILDENIHLFVLYTDYSNYIIDIIKMIGNDSILIHKKDKLKLLQKRFYKIIKNEINKGNINSLEDYLEVLNDENLDIKTLIIKGNELRYN